MFKIQELNKPETAIWLNTLETLVSTDDAADIALSKSFMQETVVSVKLIADDDKLYLSDLSFNQEIILNGNPIAPGSRVELHHNDQVLIGKDAFEIVNPSLALKRLTNNELAQASWLLEATDNWLEGQRFEVSNRATLGRDNSCDITIPGAHLSRKHAEFFVTGDKLLLKDLDSSNGSFVNGQRVNEAKLRHNDEIRLDQLNFRVIAPDFAQVDSNVDNKSTSINPAINTDQTVFSDKNEKQWVTKPTSIGNQLTDSDLLLARHQRNLRITYFIFGISIAVAVIGTVLWKL